MEIPGTLTGLCPAHSVERLRLVSRSKARAPVRMAQQSRTANDRVQGDERALEKSACC
jgi:hypothetical protein